MSESLSGKVAVISGVGSGFAKATAELFARQDKVSLVIYRHQRGGAEGYGEEVRSGRLEGHLLHG